MPAYWSYVLEALRVKRSSKPQPCSASIEYSGLYLTELTPVTTYIQGIGTTTGFPGQPVSNRNSRGTKSARVPRLGQSQPCAKMAIVESYRSSAGCSAAIFLLTVGFLPQPITAQEQPSSLYLR